MAFTTDNFNKIWASTSPLTPYEFSDSNYQEGWNFVGSTPPARQMWDFLQKRNDEKAQYIFNNFLPLSGGNVTGDLFIAGNAVESINASGTDYIRYDSGLQICWGNVTGSGTSAGAEVTFPVPFSSVPIVTATANSLTSSANHVSVQVGSVTKTSCSVSISVNATWTSASVAARYIAIGYWK